MGKYNLYNFYLPEIVYELDVFVTNKETGEPISGVTIKVTGIDTSPAGAITDEYVKTTDSEGKYIFEETANGRRYINKEKVYEIKIEKNGYLPSVNQISTVGKTKSMRFIEEVFLQPIVNETGDKIVINFPEPQFASGKYELLIDGHINSKDSLDYLIATLRQNPTIIIEIEAHADCREENAKYLSQKRAQSCVDYIISKGIDSLRLVPVGWANLMPRDKDLECATIEKMGNVEEQEAAHQRNRRVQFKVLSFDFLGNRLISDKDREISKLQKEKEFTKEEEKNIQAELENYRKLNEDIKKQNQKIEKLKEEHRKELALKDKENAQLRKENAQLRKENEETDKEISFEKNQTLTEEQVIKISKHFHAILIGIQDYSDPKFTDLDEPINNAKDLYDVLINNYTFNKENIKLLTNPKRQEIFQSLSDMKKKLTIEDNLLIFYAGHGHWDKSSEEGFWIPSDGEHEEDYTFISNSDIRRYIKGIKTMNTLLIADACFSGGMFKGRSAPITTAEMELYTLPSRKLITSGIIEEVPDKSVFFIYLLKYLKENQDIFLTSQELYMSFREAVINNSPNKQKPQFGVIKETEDEGGDFIFIRK